MSRNLTEEQFLKDVAKHQLTVMHDEDSRRHLRFQIPGTICMSFDIITWPGYLCYTGDMGTFVFSRLRDMFDFFRMEGKDRHYLKRHLAINPHYWAEKIEAADKHGGVTEYSPQKFEREVRRWLKKDRRGEGKTPKKLWDAVEDDVLSEAHNGEYAARLACTQFCLEGYEDVFQDFWEIDLHEYTHHFLWCCYALVWGIQQYDRAMIKPDWNC